MHYMGFLDAFSRDVVFKTASVYTYMIMFIHMVVLVWNPLCIFPGAEHVVDISLLTRSKNNFHIFFAFQLSH